MCEAVKKKKKLYCLFTKIRILPLTSLTSLNSIKHLRSCKLTLRVPQGSNLGPVLFNLYVRTISSNGRSNYLLYADDTTMLRHSKVVNLPQTIKEMQHEMNEVNTWSEEKNLCLICSKDKGDSLLDSANVKETQP